MWSRVIVVEAEILCKVCYTARTHLPTQRKSERSYSGAEQEYSLSEAKVKHDRAWSPNGWATVKCQALRPPSDFSGVKFCTDSTESPSEETIYRGSQSFCFRLVLHSLSQFNPVQSNQTRGQCGAFCFRLVLHSITESNPLSAIKLELCVGHSGSD